MTVKLLQILPTAVIGVESFLRGLGVLVQRNAPVQLVRTWLNLALPRDARPLKEVPHDYDSEERGMAEQDLESQMGYFAKGYRRNSEGSYFTTRE